MAKDAKPTAAEKGKGKAVEEKLPNGEGKADGSKAGPDGKLTNGKKSDEPQEGMLCDQGLCWHPLTSVFCIEDLSEEDQQLKNELEMLVSRLKVSLCRLTLELRGSMKLGIRYYFILACS